MELGIPMRLIVLRLVFRTHSRAHDAVEKIHSAQDKFLLAPLLPHKCGVPPCYGTPHLCGSEELCRAPKSISVARISAATSRRKR